MVSLATRVLQAFSLLLVTCASASPTATSTVATVKNKVHKKCMGGGASIDTRASKSGFGADMKKVSLNCMNIHSMGDSNNNLMIGFDKLTVAMSDCGLPTISSMVSHSLTGLSLT